jgi:hypothetical protein
MFNFIKKVFKSESKANIKFNSKYTDEYIMSLHEEFKRNCLYSEEELEEVKSKDSIVYKQMLQRNAAAQLVFNDTIIQIIERRHGK